MRYSLDRDFVLGQPELGQRARSGGERQPIMTNELDEMWVGRAKDAKFHQIAVELGPVCRVLSRRVAVSFAFQQLSAILS